MAPKGTRTPPEVRARMSASAREAAKTRRTRWERLFWDAIEKDDMDTAVAILADAIRRRLEKAA